MTKLRTRLPSCISLRRERCGSCPTSVAKAAALPLDSRSELADVGSCAPASDGCALPRRSRNQADLHTTIGGAPGFVGVVGDRFVLARAARFDATCDDPAVDQVITQRVRAPAGQCSILSGLPDVVGMNADA